jgi:endonuclease/exonuclease/phosphatase family metal-dependent hydrolase
MKLKFVVYNMEWMKDLFHKDGSPKRNDDPDDEVRAHGERSAFLAEVVKAINPDILCIVEGPDTLKDGSKTASQQLEAWRDLHGLNGDYKAVHGFPSGGQQELCALFRKSKVNLVHDPERNAKKNPFENPFLVDTIESLIKEQYKHYRPPFEVSVREPGQAGAEKARIIVAHTKSKGIFDAVDWARFEQLSERNRRKLYAECYSIRERCDQWLDDNPNQKIIVCGDINDGFGLDYYERRFSRSAVEILMGDVWMPDKILKHVLPRPKLNKYGWYPSSSRFRDRITDDVFNVLIDHILVSQNVTIHDAMVWNPYSTGAPQEVKSMKKALTAASDHFPVSMNFTL